MNRKLIIWIGAAIVAIGAAGVAWLWFAGGSGEPSTELTTPDIAGSETSTTQAGGDTTQTTEGGAEGTGNDPGAMTAFVIDSGQSTVSFEIDEELRGDPKHVIGETDQVAGQVQVSLDDLSSAQFSQIVVNARTFTTDSERRDRAIRGPVILNSATDENEFITFDVTSIEGLVGAVSPGDSVEFEVTGDLLIRDTTNSVTFSAQVTFVDETTVEGTATANVLRSDFGIGIPSVPGVANVTDEVILNIDFVAVSG